MGILGMIFGSKKAIDTGANVVNSVISGIDKAFFTSEEKSEAHKGIIQLVLKRAKVAMNESSIRSITRRFVAFMFVSTYLFLILAAALIYKFDPNWALHMFKCAMTLNNAIIAIVIFFFGTYGIGYVIDKKKGGN